MSKVVQTTKTCISRFIYFALECLVKVHSILVIGEIMDTNERFFKFCNVQLL